ncbi:FtsX-like permease family protein [Ruminococcaceae bacterium FB2012]|nr:FtsX-like permease family protein [Ruminococcaceae bacterium FB2012]
MTKLITITLRWMRRDRKRTLLSFFSIVLAMYMMTFLGIYFSSFISIMRSNTAYEKGTAHITVDCYSLDQAEQLSRYASVSECGYSLGNMGIFYDSFLLNYGEKSKGGSLDYFPRVTINGKDIAEINDEHYSGALVSGNYSELKGEFSFRHLRGRLPEKEGEILIDPAIADLYRVKIGEKLTLRYEVCKGTLEYIALRAPRKSVSGHNGDYDLDHAKWENADENGDPVFTEDKDGWMMKKIYRDVYSTDMCGLLHELLYTDGSPRTIHEYDPPESTEPTALIECTARLKPSGEIAESSEKTFTVVGTLAGVNLGHFTFYAGDEWARQYFRDTGTEFLARIKDNYDIDTEGREMCHSVGLPAVDEENKDGYIQTSLHTNDDLIFLEGRGYEKVTQTVILFVAAVMVVAVFVLFARLIVNNAFELSSAYRAEQYGALKTVGASNRQIFAMVMTECLLYLFTALPIAVGLAVLTGKLIMSRIMDIKIFDIAYGEGVTEKFFSLEIIPVIVAAVVFVAVFSVVMSGYACAIRIKKLSPIEAASGKKDHGKPVKRHWFIRRRFGFAAGYAARSVSRRKMHGAITLLAAVMSGMLIITLTSMIYGLEKWLREQDTDEMFDVEVYINSYEREDGILDVGAEYKKLEDSGLFRDITPISVGESVGWHDQGPKVTERLTSLLSDEFKEMYGNEKSQLETLFVQISAVTKSQFEKLKCDPAMSYDEFIKSEGVLMCDTAFSRKEEKSVTVFKEHASAVWLPVKDPTQAGGKYEKQVPAAGYYTAEEQGNLAGNSVKIQALVPIERWKDFRNLILSRSDYKDGEEEQIGFGVSVDEGKEPEAIRFVKENYTMGVNNMTYKRTRERIAEALKTAGLSLAAVIFAVSLINILSTSAAKIVNRRRELSMLRSCGMSLRQISASLVIETGVYSILTAGLSAVLGRLIAGYLFKLIDPELMPALSWYSVAAIGGLVFVLMFAAYLPTLIRLRRSPIAEDIRNKES